MKGVAHLLCLQPSGSASSEKPPLCDPGRADELLPSAPSPHGTPHPAQQPLVHLSMPENPLCAFKKRRCSSPAFSPMNQNCEGGRPPGNSKVHPAWRTKIIRPFFVFTLLDTPDYGHLKGGDLVSVDSNLEQRQRIPARAKPEW